MMELEKKEGQPIPAIKHFSAISKHNSIALELMLLNQLPKMLLSLSPLINHIILPVPTLHKNLTLIMLNYLSKRNFKRKHRINLHKNHIQVSLLPSIYKIRPMPNFSQKYQKFNLNQHKHKPNFSKLKLNQSKLKANTHNKIKNMHK